MKLGDKIHNYRISQGMTILEFAEKIGVNPEVVDYWEIHKMIPGVEDLVKIEEVFGISVDSMINDNTDTQPSYSQPSYSQPVYTYMRSAAPRKTEKPIPAGLSVISWITFSLSVASIFMAIIADIILESNGINPIIAYYCALLFTVSSIVVYIVMKVKGYSSVKNLVVGIIFTCLLLLIIAGLSAPPTEPEINQGPSF